MQVTQQELREKYEIVVANWHNALSQIKERKGRVGTMAELMRKKNSADYKMNRGSMVYMYQQL